MNNTNHKVLFFMIDRYGKSKSAKSRAPSNGDITKQSLLTEKTL